MRIHRMAFCFTIIIHKDFKISKRKTKFMEIRYDSLFSRNFVKMRFLVPHDYVDLIPFAL